MRRVTAWLWDHSAGARFARLGLAPASWAFATASAARVSAYRVGWLPQHSLPRPTISVGNLTVGGTGKTPIASWIARFFLARGAKPAVLLRGYGGDEGEVHRRAAAGAVVVENPDRVEAAATAVRAGADLLILDDGFQHLRVRRDLDIVLVAAESLAASRWRLPSGPWRESGRALARAHVGIVTRRRSTPDDAARAAAWMRSRMRLGATVAVAELRVSRLEGLYSGRKLDLSVLQGARVLAAAGIGDPESFAAQLRDQGARVHLRAWRDHHPYADADITGLLQGGRCVDFVVITAKDAAKLRDRWPPQAAEPLVAALEVCWESGGQALKRNLADLWDGGGESRFDR
ncbi:MAG: tetraacyldisaccharide 4'-kinase [Gemmatimonadetes bacterium]|nr:tetraacyldisaccharide 4'-kinase [Gemmatimonadota bacterium]